MKIDKISTGIIPSEWSIVDILQYHEKKINEIVDAFNELDYLEARTSLLEAYHQENDKKEAELDDEV